MDDKEKIKKVRWKDSMEYFEDKLLDAIVKMREFGILDEGAGQDGQPIPSEDFVESFLNELTDKERLVCNDCINNTIVRNEPLEQKYYEVMRKAMIETLGKMAPVDGDVKPFSAAMEKKKTDLYLYAQIISFIEPFDRVLYFLDDGR